jgi:hypothetical protein
MRDHAPTLDDVLAFIHAHGRSASGDEAAGTSL